MSEDEVDSLTEQNQDNTIRKDLLSLLSNGLLTEVEPRAYTSEKVNEIVARLQPLNEVEYSKKLVYAGFTLAPYNPGDDEDDEQACETCMYYLVHRKFCELPELMLPVEEEWSCRLWRI